MKDFYKVLGVEKSASQDDIKRAFRKLAHQYHPDKGGGNEAKFKEANEAYATLGDPQKRARYDQFGHTGSQGGPQPSGFGGFDFSQFGGFGQGGGPGVEFDLGDIFGAFFGGGGRHTPRGRDVRIDVEVPFRDAVFGTTREVSYERDDGSREKISVDIPAGTDDGDAFRISGRGEQGQNGKPGNLIVRVRVAPHAWLHREGAHLVGDLAVKLSEVLLGAEKTIETLDGSIKVRVPDGSHHGELIRVKGKGGIAGRGRGDLFLRLDIQMPRKLSREARAAAERLQQEGL